MKLQMIPVLLSAFFYLQGCAVVEIYGDATVKRSHNMGIASVKIMPESNLTYVKTTALGALHNNSRFTLGFVHEELISILRPSDCAAIIIVDTNDQLENLLNLLSQGGIKLDNLCTKSLEGLK